MILSALAKVFRSAGYIAFSGGLFGVVAAIILLWQNIPFIQYAITNEAVSWFYVSSLVWKLLLAAPVSIGYATWLVTVVTIALFSIVVTMFVYMYRTKQASISIKRALSSTGVGAFAALLGIGCAACGAVLLTGILTLFGAVGILLYLPLHGLEFMILALLLLMYALYAVSKLIMQPNICV